MKLKGAIAATALILLGFIIALWLFGFSSPAIAILGQSMSAGDIFNSFAGNMIATFTEHLDITITMIGIGFLAGLAGGSYAGGSLFTFLIPVMLLFVVMNIFVFPISDISAGGIFTPVSTLLAVVLNVFLMLAVLEFASGRD